MKPVLWRLVGRRLFRFSPHVAHRFRLSLLRAFGADLSGRVKIRRSVRIDCPWNLKAGHLTIFGDHATLRLRERLTIGERCVISQHAIVSTEALDVGTRSSRVAPIVIEDDCWIATDTLVLPGAHVHAGTVVGARALVEGDLEGWSVCVGQPATRLKSRTFVNASEGGDGR